MKKFMSVFMVLGLFFVLGACSEQENLGDPCDVATYSAGCTQLGKGYTECKDGVVTEVSCPVGTTCGIVENSIICKK